MMALFVRKLIDVIMLTDSQRLAVCLAACAGCTVVCGTMRRQTTLFLYGNVGHEKSCTIIEAGRARRGLARMLCLGHLMEGKTSK